MKKKLVLGIITFTLFFIVLPLVIYLKALPEIVSNQNFINFVQKQLENNLGINSIISNPVLKTSLSSDIEFSIDELYLTKNENKIISVNKFDTIISLKKILTKTIILKRLGADFIYADINKLTDIVPKDKNKKEKKNNIDIDIFDSVLYVKNSLIQYKPNNDTYLNIQANNLNVDNTQKEQRFLHFDLSADIKKAGKNLHFNINDDNSVYFKDKHFWVKNCFLDFNKSKIFFNVNADKKKNFNIDISSNNMDIQDILTFLDSQIIENNIQDSLSYFKDIEGNFRFNLKYTNDTIDGKFIVNNAGCKIIPVNNIPVTITQGKILMTKDKITLKDVKGYYNHKKENEITMEGTVNDYLKSIDTKLTARSVVSNDFMKNYLSKMVGMPVELTGGTTKTRLELKSINNKIDMVWLFGIKKGQDILLDGASFSPAEFARGVKGDMHLENNLLTIKSLDYYIVPEFLLTKENRGKIRPLLKFSGNIDIANNSQIRDLGFNIPEPMPSEFLNLLIGDKIFKNGKVSGNMYYNNTKGTYPVLEGNLTMDMVAIPSQRVFVKHGEMNASNQTIQLIANGGYRRSKYDFSGTLANEVKFPIVVKNIDLSVDNIDVEKFLASANNQNSEAIKTEQFDLKPSGTAKDEDDNTPTFDIGNFVVEKCKIKIKEGKYKKIAFSDVEADLTLDKNSILNINSNQFNIANGESSAKINCDLKKHKYNMVLGVLNIDSDLIASNLLQMEKEISGKASGIIDLNTDNSMKLNGSMKFVIKDGTIQKVGLVEYILKFAALFRNPLTMISPSIFSDLVNIPDGKFKEISGTLKLKDNVIERMMIKSSSPQLSAFIVGAFNLETRDAALRIYTKFSNKNKGIYGVLRNISLNSLANRIPLTTRSDSNYYSAELSMLPPIDADEKDCQVFLTKVDGDIEHNNFISSLKKIK